MPICFEAASIKHPFGDCELALLANEASENDTNLRSSMGML